jgi:hypothetical protein
MYQVSIHKDVEDAITGPVIATWHGSDAVICSQLVDAHRAKGYYVEVHWQDVPVYKPQVPRFDACTTNR